MKRYSIIGLGLSVTLAMTVLVATPTLAQDKAKQERSQAGKLDDKTAGANIRASQLIGMNIQNRKGESVGKVNDIVLDASTGKIRYAAVTYGGFVGIGDKMFAVPFEVFKCQQDPNDRDEHVLVLDVTQKQLEGAKGFDQDHWPNFGDHNFTGQLDKRYGVDRQRKRNVDVDVDVETKRERD